MNEPKQRFQDVDYTEWNDQALCLEIDYLLMEVYSLKRSKDPAIIEERNELVKQLSHIQNIRFARMKSSLDKFSNWNNIQLHDTSSWWGRVFLLHSYLTFK